MHCRLLRGVSSFFSLSCTVIEAIEKSILFNAAIVELKQLQPYLDIIHNGQQGGQIVV